MAAFDAQKTLELELAASSVLPALARAPVLRHAHASRPAGHGPMDPGAATEASMFRAPTMEQESTPSFDTVADPRIVEQANWPLETPK